MKQTQKIVALLVILIATVTLAGCGGGGGDFGTASLSQRTAILHPGETVIIQGQQVGYCKHAWKIDESTGSLRQAIVFGDPTNTTLGSPWGAGMVYDYIRLDSENIETFKTDYECYVRKIYVHPDEGTNASDDIHRASWIEIVWYE